VKVDAAGLQPATTYYYGFEALGQPSLTGRTRTAPIGRVDRLRFALVSCSNYAAGYFNPYARLADRDDLDAVVHVGDYLYESATVSSLPDRRHEPRKELVALEDYRVRYGQYRLDPDLRRAHQQHPWIVVWDDHESCNDAWQDGAPQHDPATEGDWQVRKRAAVRAYREWMPIRWPDEADEIRIWRSLPYGDLVDLILIDTRLYGRNAPGTGTDLDDPSSNDPQRSMLGPAQFAFLTEQLSASRDRGTAWRLVGNQTMISPHTNNPTSGPPIPYLPDGAVETVDLRQGGGNEGRDNWGAYRVERDRIVDHLRSNDIRDNVVLTGDIHTAWGCDVVEDPANPAVYDRVTGRGSVGVEIVCTSVTSNNLEETTMADDAIAGVNAAIIASNQNVQYTDQSGHGYTLLDVDRDRVLAEWWETGTARQRSTGENVEAVYETLRGSNHLTPALAASEPPADQPDPAPEQPPAGGPAPVVPEAPGAALLPVAAAAAVGAVIALRRRGDAAST
jgi:alkaline phosphatase D